MPAIDPTLRFGFSTRPSAVGQGLKREDCLQYCALGVFLTSEVILATAMRAPTTILQDRAPPGIPKLDEYGLNADVRINQMLD
jgi:hypothetical protein